MRIKYLILSCGIGMILMWSIYLFTEPKIVGGYLHEDGWLIIKCKRSVFNPFYEKFLLMRIDDEFVLKQYRDSLKTKGGK